MRPGRCVRLSLKRRADALALKVAIATAVNPNDAAALSRRRIFRQSCWTAASSVNAMKLLLLAAALIAANFANAATLDATTQSKVDAKVKEIQGWAAADAIVSAVRSTNAAKTPEAAAMNQDKWKTLTLLDPFVRSLAKNPAGEFLRSKKSDAVTEAFLSAADGSKVAFLSKSSNWSHKGKPKHDVPMSGKTWRGDVEVDESTGLQQVQVAVPVMDGGKAIGSLVVGLSIGALSH
jgi:hypothetical protein